MKGLGYTSYRWGTSLLLLGILLVAGCQTTETFFLGYRADHDRTVPLITTDGSWKSFDLNLTYRMEAETGRLNITGTLDFSLYHQLNSAMINRLALYLFFLDDQNQVLQATNLLSTLHADPATSFPFAANVAVPPGSRAIAFGYEGQSSEDGGKELGGAGASFFFSDLPRRPR
ncbi:MAG: hypothetical protein RQ754_03300 [Desulfuromonadales bacterium]|nr:hypothetical protein [Desulfuromonadales bacterium]